ncbi:hypothetical protein ACW7G5_03985 [Luteimonas sp. A501]
MGFGTALRAQVLIRSCALGLGVGVLWLAVFLHFHDQVGQIAFLLAFSLVMGLMLPLGMVTQVATIPYSASGGMAAIGEVVLPGIPNAMIWLFNIAVVLLYILALAAAVVVLLWLVAYLITTMMLSRGVMREHIELTFADSNTGSSDESTWREVPVVSWRQRLKWGIALCVPILGGILMLVLLSRWVVRPALYWMMPKGLSKGERARLITCCNGPATFLGAMLILVAAVPLLNLMLPALLLACAGHLSRRVMSGKYLLAGNGVDVNKMALAVDR